jgi:hypothetical protein
LIIFIQTVFQKKLFVFFFLLLLLLFRIHQK